MKGAPQQTEEALVWLSRALFRRGAKCLIVQALAGGETQLVVVMPDTVKMANTPLDLVAWLQKEGK